MTTTTSEEEKMILWKLNYVGSEKGEDSLVINQVKEETMLKRKKTWRKKEERVFALGENNLDI